MSRTALILIDIQSGFEDPYWGESCNKQIKDHALELLQGFRHQDMLVVHVRHLSLDTHSPLHPSRDGVKFMEGFEPDFREAVFDKQVNSAFIGTNLKDYLEANQISQLVFAGYTSDHCVSTSVRMAANYGFKCIVASDATTTFPRIDQSGEKLDASLVHRVSLASLRGEFAEVMSTGAILRFILR